MPESVKSRISSTKNPSGGPVTNNTLISGDNDICFNAYMDSKMGAMSDTNNDNYYMNGIFMKNFKFTDVKKYIENRSECAVFAVSTGITTDRASKLIMRFLDQKRDWMAASKNVKELEKRLADTIMFCNSCLFLEGEVDKQSYESSLAIAVYFHEYLVYAACGDAMAICIKNHRIKNTNVIEKNLGITKDMDVSVNRIPFSKTDRFVLCSKGIFSKMSVHDIGLDVLKDRNVEVIVDKIINHAGYYRDLDCTCMAIEAVPSRLLRMSTKIIAAVCGLITLVNIVLLFWMRGGI